jgi:hypothetical protein
VRHIRGEILLKPAATASTRLSCALEPHYNERVSRPNRAMSNTMSAIVG